MILPNIIETVANFIDGEIQFQNFWEIRSVRFDIDPDDEYKKFQKYLAISYHVQDAKGNAGLKGQFFITNLRVIWQLSGDHYVNLSFGLDTIININIKTTPVAGNNTFRYLLTVKTENSSQGRYDFKFIGFTEKQLEIFQKLQKLHKKVVQTKSYRCTNLGLKCDPHFQPMDQQQIKSEYKSCRFMEDNMNMDCVVILTNIRMVILKKQEKKMNYGIPWLMIKSIEPIQVDDKKAIYVRCRGILGKKQLKVICAKVGDTKKLTMQLTSYCETYNKTPQLGFEYKKQEIKQQDKIKPAADIEEIEYSKVNLLQRKSAYSSDQTQGILSQTFFNKEIGLMMQKFPENVQRKDLWEILRN